MGCHSMCCPHVNILCTKSRSGIIAIGNIKIIEYFLSPYTYGIWDQGKLLY